MPERQIHTIKALFFKTIIYILPISQSHKPGLTNFKFDFSIVKIPWNFNKNMIKYHAIITARFILQRIKNYDSPSFGAADLIQSDMGS